MQSTESQKLSPSSETPKKTSVEFVQDTVRKFREMIREDHWPNRSLLSCPVRHANLQVLIRQEALWSANPNEIVFSKLQ
jgi:hypothetical protein